MFRKIARELKRNFRNSSTSADDLIASFRSALIQEFGSGLSGIYIIGSYALNDFNPRLSDIDFIVSLQTAVSQQQAASLKKIHRQLESITLQPNLNGIYIPEKELGKSSAEIASLTYFHEGQLKTVSHRSNYYEINPINWMELASHAITVYGKPSEELDLIVSWEKVNQYLHANINSYWARWLAESQNPFHPYYYASLLRRSENAWCVTGVARQLYSLRTQKITSKRKACSYFLDKLPGAYVPILQDSISYRLGQQSRPAWRQKRETLQFMAYCIESFNREFANKSAC